MTDSAVVRGVLTQSAAAARFEIALGIDTLVRLVVVLVDFASRPAVRAVRRRAVILGKKSFALFTPGQTGRGGFGRVIETLRLMRADREGDSR